MLSAGAGEHQQSMPVRAQILVLQALFNDYRQTPTELHTCASSVVFRHKEEHTQKSTHNMCTHTRKSTQSKYKAMLVRTSSAVNKCIMHIHPYIFLQGTPYQLVP
jgi:hypothetical protein